jgi:hypothetical protein
LDLNKLRLLKEDDALDQDMLAPSSSSKKQRWKSSSLREQCREAYRYCLFSLSLLSLRLTFLLPRHALAEMVGDEDDRGPDDGEGSVEAVQQELEVDAMQVDQGEL